MATETLTAAHCAKCALKHSASCFFDKHILNTVDGSSVKHSALTVRSFNEGQKIFERGEQHRYVAVVASGVVRRCAQQKNGEIILLSINFSSSVIGMPFIEAPPYDVEAAAAVTLCCFDKSALERLIVLNSAIERAWMITLLEENERLNQLSNVLQPTRVSERIASLLLALCREGPANSMRTVRVSVSRLDMAALLRTTPETLSRVIQTLVRGKILTIIDSRNFIVVDLPRLVEVAGNPLVRVGSISYLSVRSQLFWMYKDNLSKSKRLKEIKVPMSVPCHVQDSNVGLPCKPH